MNPFREHKILAHLPILGQYLSGGTYAPIQVEIDLTNVCSSACPWCAGFQDRLDKPYVLFGEHSRGKVFSLLEELHSLGVKSVTWTGGGDPTMHPDHGVLIAESHRLGMDNGLITNGVIDVTDCVRDCKWIRFSVDAATEFGYEKQHGRRHHFQRVLRNVVNAASIKGDTTIGVGFVTAPAVMDEIEAFPLLWRDIPVDYIQYRPLMDHYGQHYQADHQEIARRVRAASLLDRRVVCSEGKYSAQERGDSGKTDRCHGTFLEIAIAADGCVYNCCHLKGMSQYALGSLHEESFTSIWSRHISQREFRTTADCPLFCRHYATNRFIEESVLAPRDHVNFI